MGQVKAGSTHLTWGNIESDETWSTFLKDCSDLGHHGISCIEFMMGERYKRPSEVKADAEAHNLEVCALDQRIEVPEDDYYKEGCEFLNTVGGEVLVLLGGNGYEDEDFKRVSDDLNRIGRICTAEGVKAVYHHHTNNTAENFEQFKKLMSMTAPSVFHAMVDTGHITKDMRPDPAHEVIKHFADRLVFIELKDWTEETNLTSEVGHGDCDHDAVWQTLKDIDYSGWLVVEQNGAVEGRPPRESARMSRESIRNGMGV